MKKVEIKRLVETRALPPLVEEMNNHIEAMNKLVDGADTEKRALNDEEVKTFNELKAKVDGIKETIKIQEDTRAYIMTPAEEKEKENDTTKEERAFIDYVRGDTRALDVGNNGGVIPQTIANKIIEKVKELSPIYRLATRYNVSGDLVFPIYDESSSAVGAKYVEDMEELTEGTGKFTTVKLTNYIVGCLAKVSKSLMNRSDFDLLGFIIDKVSQAIAEFIEKELLTGKTKASGLVTIAQDRPVTALNADNLIDLQLDVIERYQAGSVWIIHKDHVRALRKLKDNDGNYILNKDLTTEFGWTLLGKAVHFSENCPLTNVFYGDMSGLYVKLTKNVELQLLTEKYATQYAVGCCGYVEFDSKVVEPQKLAKMTISATK